MSELLDINFGFNTEISQKFNITQRNKYLYFNAL